MQETKMQNANLDWPTGLQDPSPTFTVRNDADQSQWTYTVPMSLRYRLTISAALADF
jgi:hypothetical protein